MGRGAREGAGWGIRTPRGASRSSRGRWAYAGVGIRTLPAPARPIPASARAQPPALARSPRYPGSARPPPSAARPGGPAPLPSFPLGPGLSIAPTGRRGKWLRQGQGRLSLQVSREPNLSLNPAAAAAGALLAEAGVDGGAGLGCRARPGLRKLARTKACHVGRGRAWP